MRVIAGQFRGKKLISPESETTRPTSDRARESLFNLLENHVRRMDKTWQEIVFADVFAGTGAVGVEAVSRGVCNCYFFEKDKMALKVLQQNIKGIENQTCILGDALKPIKKPKAVDIIFMDPPYGKGLWVRALLAFLEQDWIDKKTLVVVEVDKGEPETLPDGFELIDKRSYGRNTFLFLGKIKNQS